MPDAVGMDLNTATRVLKATRVVESLGLSPEPARDRPSFSIVQVFVPRVDADANGWYKGDIYICDTSTTPETWTLVASNKWGKPLPSSL